MVRLISCDKIPIGQALFLEHGDKELAIYHLDNPDRFVVSDNTCPHANGNLSGGEINENTVSCPWHHWQFDLTTGQCVHSPKATVRIYRSEIRDGHVFSDLNAV